MSFLSVTDGKPVIGPIPGLPKVLLASGHEGDGISMVIFSLTKVPLNLDYELHLRYFFPPLLKTCLFCSAAELSFLIRIHVG